MTDVTTRDIETILNELKATNVLSNITEILQIVNAVNVAGGHTTIQRINEVLATSGLRTGWAEDHDSFGIVLCSSDEE